MYHMGGQTSASDAHGAGDYVLEEEKKMGVLDSRHHLPLGASIRRLNATLHSERHWCREKTKKGSAVGN